MYILQYVFYARVIYQNWAFWEGGDDFVEFPTYSRMYLHNVSTLLNRLIFHPFQDWVCTTRHYFANS